MIHGDVFVEDRWDFLSKWLLRNKGSKGIMNNRPNVPHFQALEDAGIVYIVPRDLEIIKARL
jgi:hypothetical protein